MSKRREDADYGIVQTDGGSFTFEDKRTGHKQYFNECQPNGFKGTVFLYHYPTGHVEDPSPTIGFKCAHLDKDSLPDWLIEEFEHIREHGCLTPATDPRGDDDA
jgi:hypothetical protein